MVILIRLVLVVLHYVWNNISLDDLGSVEGDNVMTIHQKLDFLMENSPKNKNQLLFLASTTSMVDLHDFIKDEYIPEYEFGDFIIVNGDMGSPSASGSITTYNAGSTAYQEGTPSGTYDPITGIYTVIGYTKITTRLATSPGGGINLQYYYIHVPIIPKIYLLVNMNHIKQ